MDYGTNDNSITSNLTIETTRAFTGHEQIAELSGLIHMNARVYDSDIGRFLSADTIVQDPRDSQAYNRYAYVRNNPMMFTDPSGHSWFSKKWKKFKRSVKKRWKKIVGVVLIIVGIVVAIYLPTIGAAIAGAGVSLYNYDKTGKFEFTLPVGNIDRGGGKSPAEQEEQLDAIQDEGLKHATIPTGTENTLGASSDNSKYANGAGTGSYETSSGDISINDKGEYEYSASSLDTQNKNRTQLENTIIQLTSNSSNLDSNLIRALNSDLSYIDDPRLNMYGDPDNFYAGGKRSDGTMDITSLAYRGNIYGDNHIGIYGPGVVLSSQDRLEITLIHEAHHYSYGGLLGPRGPGRHEPDYYNRVGRDWMIYKGGQAHLF